MFDRMGFRNFFFDKIGESQNTLNTYNSYLGRIDAATGGLDDKISADGGEGLLSWIAASNEEPFASHRSQALSVARAYLRFWGAQGDVTGEDEPTPAENARSVFRYEAELQAAVRNQLNNIEAGLRIDDGGKEQALTTGRSDILARDVKGRAVVIELKAGPCPKGAFEQVLGYAQDLVDDGEQHIRCFLIAGNFSERQFAAARQIPALTLRTYHLAVQFTDPAEMALQS